MDRILKWNFKRNFGIEYEFNGTRRNLEYMATIVREQTNQAAQVRPYEHTRNNYATWVCKTDSSCGIELVSPILSGSSQLKKAAEILLELEDNDFAIDDRCGQHVHIDISDFTKQQVGIMASYWMKIERFILNGTPSHRRKNRFCEPLTHFNTNIRANYQYSLESARDMTPGRRAINFQNYESINNTGTVEFRFGEMTFDPEIIKNRVRFLIWFVEMCKILPQPSNLNWMTPKQVLLTLNLWENSKSTIKYKYSPAIQSMRKWLLSRLIEFAPETFKKDSDKCKIMLEDIERAEECA